jgi:hypothetical protein
MEDSEKKEKPAISEPSLKETRESFQRVMEKLSIRRRKKKKRRLRN